MDKFLVITVGAIIAIGAAIALAIFSALPVWLLWNAVIPQIFGLTEITFMQALFLSLLCSLLFKSSSSGSNSK